VLLGSVVECSTTMLQSLAPIFLDSPRNAYRRERLGTDDLLIKVTCFVKEVNIIII